MNEKLCIFCQHCDLENDRGYGSTWTGEYGSSGFNCDKNHFSHYDQGEDRLLAKGDMDDYRAFMLQAEKCPDYLPIKAHSQTDSTTEHTPLLRRP